METVRVRSRQAAAAIGIAIAAVAAIAVATAAQGTLERAPAVPQERPHGPCEETPITDPATEQVIVIRTQCE